MKKANILLFASAILLTACGEKRVAPAASKSSLRGTFTNSYVKEMKFKKTMEDNNSYLFASTYPAFLINDNTTIYYAVDQKLTLKSDYSYKYEYSITLQNSSYADVLSVEVLMIGTYTYEALTTNPGYYVQLENPVEGTETVYGATITNLFIFDYWKKLPEASYSIKFEDVIDDPSFTYDNYTKGRKVLVTKADDVNPSLVQDVVYYRFILDEMMKYSVVAQTR